MEIKTKVQAYRVTKRCDSCKVGLMTSTGNAFSNSVARYAEHRCTKCGVIETYKNVKYPYITYKEIE